MHADPRIAVRGFEVIIVTGSSLLAQGSRTGSSFHAGRGSVELVESAHSHFFLWVGCVEELTEVLWNVPAEQRERTVYVLGAVWRLLPGNRLREIRICLFRI